MKPIERPRPTGRRQPTTHDLQKCWDEATQSFIGTVAGDCGVGTVVFKFVQVRAQANASLTCSSGTMTITPSK